MINKKGFTLIELLVVVLIIGILAAVAIPLYMKTLEKTRSSEALLNLSALAHEANRYYLRNNNSYIYMVGTDGPQSGYNFAVMTHNLDITVPATDKSWFRYVMRSLTADALDIEARRPSTSATMGDADWIYSVIYLSEKGQIVKRICRDKQSGEICRSLFAIEGTGTCGTGASYMSTSGQCVIK